MIKRIRRLPRTAAALAAFLSCACAIAFDEPTDADAASGPSGEAVACRVGLVLKPGEGCRMADGARFSVREDGCVGERPPLPVGDGRSVTFSVGDAGATTTFSVGGAGAKTTYRKGPDGEKTNVRTVTCTWGHIQVGGFRATEVVDAGGNVPGEDARPWRIDGLPAPGDAEGRATIIHSEGPAEGSLVTLRFGPGSSVPAVGASGSLTVPTTVSLFGIQMSGKLDAGECEVVSADGNVVVVRITDRKDGSVRDMLSEAGSVIVFEPDG